MREHRRHLKKHKACFTGRAAVQWMIDAGIAEDVPAAVARGAALVDAGLVRGIRAERAFQNRSFLYRFNVAMDPGLQAARWCLSREMTKMQGRVHDVCSVVDRHTAATRAIATDHAAAMERLEKVLVDVRTQLAYTRAACFMIAAACASLLALRAVEEDDATGSGSAAARSFRSWAAAAGGGGLGDTTPRRRHRRRLRALRPLRSLRHGWKEPRRRSTHRGRGGLDGSLGGRGERRGRRDDGDGFGRRSRLEGRSTRFGDERISDDGDDDGDGDHHSSGHVHCAGYARRARVRSRRERFRRRDVVFYPSNARFRDAQSSSARLDPSSHSRRERERELAGESSIRLRGEPRCGRGCVRASLAPSSRGVVGGVRERGRGGREGARRDSTLA